MQEEKKMMLAFNIDDFEDILPARGGKKGAVFSLSGAAAFRANKNYIDEEGLKKMEYVKVMAKKEGRRIIVVLEYLDKKEPGVFSLSKYVDKQNKDKYSFSFSARSIFNKYKIKIEDVVKDKSIKFEPKIEKVGDKKYYVIEIEEGK